MQLNTPLRLTETTASRLALCHLAHHMMVLHLDQLRVTGDAGIVDHDVNAPEFRMRRLGGGRDLGGVRHVHAIEGCAATLRRDRRHHLLSGRFRQIPDRDRRAGPGKSNRRLAADAVRAPGNDGDAIFQCDSHLPTLASLVDPAAARPARPALGAAAGFVRGARRASLVQAPGASACPGKHRLCAARAARLLDAERRRPVLPRLQRAPARRSYSVQTLPARSRKNSGAAVV